LVKRISDRVRSRNFALGIQLAEDPMALSVRKTLIHDDGSVLCYNEEGVCLTDSESYRVQSGKGCDCVRFVDRVPSSVVIQANFSVLWQDENSDASCAFEFSRNVGELDRLWDSAGTLCVDCEKEGRLLNRILFVPGSVLLYSRVEGYGEDGRFGTKLFTGSLKDADCLIRRGFCHPTVQRGREPEDFYAIEECCGNYAVRNLKVPELVEPLRRAENVLSRLARLTERVANCTDPYAVFVRVSELDVTEDMNWLCRFVARFDARKSSLFEEVRGMHRDLLQREVYRPPAPVDDEDRPTSKEGKRENDQ
jgi:hypothetical protein